MSSLETTKIKNQPTIQQEHNKKEPQRGSFLFMNYFFRNSNYFLRNLQTNLTILFIDIEHFKVFAFV